MLVWPISSPKMTRIFGFGRPGGAAGCGLRLRHLDRRAEPPSRGRGGKRRAAKQNIAAAEMRFSFLSWPCS